MIPELANYLGRIEDLRNQVAGLISDLPAEALNWRPLDANGDHVTNSLAVLATHAAGAEHFWISEIVGDLPKTRNRDAEFTTVATSGSEIIALLDKNRQETREVFSSLKESDLNDTREVDGKSIPVRWCILHVIDHTALHLGHMQITTKLWIGGANSKSPRWFERLPNYQEF